MLSILAHHLYISHALRWGNKYSAFHCLHCNNLCSLSFLISKCLSVVVNSWCSVVQPYIYEHLINRADIKFISKRVHRVEIYLIMSVMQPLDVILSQDHNQIVALLEYVRYDFQPQIQLCSIKILSILRQFLILPCIHLCLNILR